ncbi:MSHA biogenesis protein MshJ [Colwellia chukchiensis]|uniref:MSHA biogenesis protein MshJ n=1 Tax=Colwellia chukchiensis TaxID=641665 RepID=A0A1H7LBN5_9GAMM|nr:hypothetical protein [Colwellia chukchiensis]SEK96246.1 MSHA biogenesis protein MshJ [Colwellia chukchiensis]
MSQWQTYSEKFSALSAREQYLIIATGVVAILFIGFSVFLDTKLQQVGKLQQQVTQTQQSNANNESSIELLQQALLDDPNTALQQELAQYQAKLADIDQQLLTLTSDLIDPIEMRYALIKLLKLQKGVKLLSFEVLPARPITENNVSNRDTEVVTNTAPDDNALAPEQQLRLYRHGIKIKLQGQYFQLRDYLAQLENLSWKFFWQEFDYQLKNYPISELEVEIYSLSTAQEFIGV